MFDALYYAIRCIVLRPTDACESAPVFTTVHNGPIEVTQIPKLTEIVDLVSRNLTKVRHLFTCSSELYLNFNAL